MKDESLDSLIDSTTADSSTAYEMASYETEAPIEQLPPVLWSVQKYDVAQLLALSGLKITEISKATKVPLGTINAWRKSTEFMEYVNRITLESAALLKAKRLQVLTKTLDARIRKIEEDEDGDWAKASRKDTLDILKEIREETEVTEEKEESSYMKLLEKLMLTSNPPQLVELPSPD